MAALPATPSVHQELADVLKASETVNASAATAAGAWTDLLLARRKVVCHPKSVATSTERAPPLAPRLLFPGSFHPLHEGHCRMAQIAAARLHESVWLEISITNVDKPPLDFLTIRERLMDLASYNVCLTRAPTFLQKAALFEGATFVVGADTLKRIADVKYYHGSPKARDAAVLHLERMDAHFLVFGRVVGGHFTSLDDLSLPSRLAGLCVGVSESEFRNDISSTQMRLAEQD